MNTKVQRFQLPFWLFFFIPHASLKLFNIKYFLILLIFVITDDYTYALVAACLIKARNPPPPIEKLVDKSCIYNKKNNEK